jgi:hypothetical protein
MNQQQYDEGSFSYALIAGGGARYPPPLQEKIPLKQLVPCESAPTLSTQGKKDGWDW